MPLCWVLKRLASLAQAMPKAMPNAENAENAEENSWREQSWMALLNMYL